MPSETQTMEPAAFLQGGGCMGEQIRRFDWTTTPLGRPESWPVSLRTALRILLTTNHPVFLFWGPSLTCFYNDAYSRSLGPEQHPRILGMDGHDAWQDIWHIIGPQIGMVLRGEGATWFENQLIPLTRHGRREDVYWTYSYGPIYDDDAPHQVGGVMVLCTETTAHVNAAARERRDAAQWRAIFENSPAFMCVLNGPDHVFTYGNPKYREVIGRAEMPIGLSVAEALPEVVSQGYVDVLDHVYRTGETYEAKGAVVHLAGRTRHIDFIYQPMRDLLGDVVGILVQGFDVTERERAHSALASAATRLQLATDAGDIGIHEYAIKTGVLFWDRRVRELWGFDADEEVTYEKFLAGLIEEDREPTQRAVDRSLCADGDRTYLAEYRVRNRRDGSVRWVRATGLVQFEQGEAVRMVGTVQDVTREKHDRATLLEADRQKDVFLATLAHELRNPLAPIRSSAELLAMPGVTPAQLEWVHSVITRQTAHMTTLLNDLLDVARLSQGRMVLSTVPVDLREVVEMAMETVQPALRAKRHHLTVHMPPDEYFVTGDVVRLAQVFTNLLSNAVKYMLAGGEITVTATRVGEKVSVSIRDTGDGIRSEALGDIFGMFRQSTTSLERAEGGLGIGLALVRAIVELHGGTVTACSDGLGHGSTFTVVLPLLGVSAAIASPGAPARSIVPAHAPRRVLITDDSEDAATSLRHLLEAQGHIVAIARNGHEALAALDTFQPDVLLLDIGMPVMNGYEVAESIRAMPYRERVRLIALTGWGQARDRQRAMDAGFDAHLTKPVDFEMLTRELTH